MAIDGSVWVVTGNQIQQFVQGEEAVWQISGLDSAFADKLDLYTDELCRNLYILDVKNQRLVVVDKDGVYLSQYQWQKAYPVTSLAVSEKLHKILLLSGDTIYEIELK